MPLLWGVLAPWELPSPPTARDVEYRRLRRARQIVVGVIYRIFGDQKEK